MALNAEHVFQFDDCQIYDMPHLEIFIHLTVPVKYRFSDHIRFWSNRDQLSRLMIMLLCILADPFWSKVKTGRE